MNIYPCQKWWG